MEQIFKTIEVQPYQFSQLVKVMVVDVHPIFNHQLERLFVHKAGEGDRVLLGTIHHRHSKKSRVEIVHVRNGGIPLVEGSPLVDNRLSSLWTRDQCVHGWTVPFHLLNIRAQHHLVDHPHPARAGHSKSGQKGSIGSLLRMSLP